MKCKITGFLILRCGYANWVREFCSQTHFMETLFMNNVANNANNWQSENSSWTTVHKHHSGGLPAEGVALVVAGVRCYSSIPPTLPWAISSTIARICGTAFSITSSIHTCWKNLSSIRILSWPGLLLIQISVLHGSNSNTKPTRTSFASQCFWSATRASLTSLRGTEIASAPWRLKLWRGCASHFMGHQLTKWAITLSWCTQLLCSTDGAYCWAWPCWAMGPQPQCVPYQLHHYVDWRSIPRVERW